jgi:hypothetical protein
VKILGGGSIKIDTVEYYYLIMEFIEGNNLKKYIIENDITMEFIKDVINTLITVTENLLNNTPQFVHRDIKPENIMISKNGNIFLMDLGVIKIIGVSSITDVDEKQFLGTLRYAPPEFLTREEKDDINGWRAVNIYQIGAVLHDLIMKKELFSNEEPYAKLVIAIKEDMPKIINSSFHPDLIQLARNMLQKDWKKRLESVSIPKINEILKKCLLPQKEPDNLYDSILTNALPIQAEIEEIENISRSLKEKNNIKEEIHKKIWKRIDDCFTYLKNNDFIESVKITEMFKLNDGINIVGFKKNSKIYRINGKFDFGFARPIIILVSIINDEKSYCKVMLTGIVPENYFDEKKNNDPLKMLFSIFGLGKNYPSYNTTIAYDERIEISYTCIFDGIIETEDNTIKDLLDKKIAIIIKSAINIMKPDIAEQLKMRREQLAGGHGVSVITRISKGPIIIDAIDGGHTYWRK